MNAFWVKDIARDENDFYIKTGPASVYRVDPKKGDIEYVFVSTSRVAGRWETFAFHSDAEGNVISWSELDGSMKDCTSHEAVLREMGYELAETELVTP